MKVKLSQKVLEQFPSLEYTVILIKNVDNSRKQSNINQLLRGATVVLKNEYKKPHTKDVFNQIFGPSLAEESTLLESYLLNLKIKKVLNGKELEGGNNLYNLVQYISLKMNLPLFGFDLDQAEKDYEIDLFSSKKGKKSPDFDFLPQTKFLALWFPNLAQWSEEELNNKIIEIENIFIKYANTYFDAIYKLNANQIEADLDYVSDLEAEYLSNQVIAENLEKIADVQDVKAAESAEDLESDLKTTDAEFIDFSKDLENTIQEFEAVAVESDQNVTLPAAKNIKIILGEALQNALLKAYPDFTGDVSTEIETPKDLSHGDYASGIALKLSKVLGEAPLVIAEKIKSSFVELKELEEIVILGPGFINFRLSENYFSEKLEEIILKKSNFGKINLGQNQQVMIEFGSLNIAKPFGAHHLLTTVIGNTLANLHRSAGYDVIAADYPGDWGTQFGKLLYAYKTWGNKEQVVQDPVNELLKLYILFHEKEENDADLTRLGREEFKKLEEGDLENQAIWEWIKEVSLKEIDKIMNTLGVKYDWRKGESEFVKSAHDLLIEYKKKGLIVEGENNAFIVNLDNQNLPPVLLQKGDGSSIYATRDLASIKQRIADFPELKKLIYVVDVAQTLHFNQVFATARLMNLVNEDVELKHVVYGRMSLPDMQMSTRKGTVVMAVDIIKEALEKAQTLVNEKSAGLPENERKNIASAMAISAIKYAMICQAPESNFSFEWNKVLSFDGNSAPYLQYSLARAKNILRKADERLSEKLSNSQEDQTSLFSIEEIAKAKEEEQMTVFGLDIEQKLLKHLIKLPDALENAVKLYKPNLLTSYLFELAQIFNSFYGAVQVLKTERNDLFKARLKLVEATMICLESGLETIDIARFERM